MMHVRNVITTGAVTSFYCLFMTSQYALITDTTTDNVILVKFQRQLVFTICTSFTKVALQSDKVKIKSLKPMDLNVKAVNI